MQFTCPQSYQDIAPMCILEQLECLLLVYLFIYFQIDPKGLEILLHIEQI